MRNGLVRSHHFGSAVLDGCIYVVGGCSISLPDCKTSPKSSTYRLDPRVGQWTPVTDMNTARLSVGVCALDNALYAVGGTKTRGKNGQLCDSDDVEVFEPRANTWRKVKKLRHPRSEVATANVKGLLYVLGGRTTFDGECRSTGLSTVEIYNVKKVSKYVPYLNWYTH
jgi:N-acetylneuraminic acid mutarotase